MKEKIRAWKVHVDLERQMDSVFWLDQTKLAINDYGYVILYENLDKLNKIKARNGFRKNWNEVRSMIHWLARIDPWAVRPLQDCYYHLLKVHMQKWANKDEPSTNPQVLEAEKFYCQSMYFCIMEIAKKYDKAKVKYDNATNLQEVI